MNIEYMLYPMILKVFDNINLPIHIISILFILYYLVDVKLLRKKIQEYIDKKFRKIRNQIEFTYTDRDITDKYKAISHKITGIHNDTIYKIKEFSTFGYEGDDWSEKTTGYEICQNEEFHIEGDIYGKYELLKEKSKNVDGDSKTIKTNKLYIMSSKLSIPELKQWVDKCIEEYKTYLKDKNTEQLLLTVCYTNSRLRVEGTPWSSTIKFENSYFPDKENIMNQINFFLNNKHWYKEKGIPYNFGIILYGEPGCGKTRFIKMLLNHTGFNGLDIKLNNDFDFNSLKYIMHNEDIDGVDEDYHIPQNKRIIIFEDIDSMCDKLKARELEKEDNNSSENDDDKDKLLELLAENVGKKVSKKRKKETSKSNNNLSFFLNLIDGLNECSGRIIVMTTNRIEYLDPAIIRPGRIDLKIHCHRYSTFDVQQIIKKFWDIDIDINNMKELDDKYTSAEIINIFRSTNNFDDIKDIFLK